MTLNHSASDLSHTRGVPLANLAGLCLVLRQSERPLSVRELVERAMALGIIETKPLPKGGPLPSRINHHIISLRVLNLVSFENSNGHVYYKINSTGRRLSAAVIKNYSGEGAVELDSDIRALWRSILVKSSYVRSSWLKYFMASQDFDLSQLLRNNTSIEIVRVSPRQRASSGVEKNKGQFTDSGYRIRSQYWPEQVINDVARREILHGLRHWTSDAYLTDETVPAVEAAPFAHFSNPENSSSSIEIDCFIVTAWFDPSKDLHRFERLIEELFDQRGQGNRISIPDLIISVSVEHHYARENIKEMLVRLFYERRDRYFFERGSKFLVERAFKLTSRDRPSVYYLNLEGAWRTSLVRFGKARGQKQ